jgi:hypothetical protein
MENDGSYLSGVTERLREILKGFLRARTIRRYWLVAGDFCVIISLAYNTRGETVRKKADERVKQLLAGKEIVNEIVVPGRLVNFVVRD